MNVCHLSLGICNIMIGILFMMYGVIHIPLIEKWRICCFYLNNREGKERGWQGRKKKVESSNDISKGILWSTSLTINNGSVKIQVSQLWTLSPLRAPWFLSRSNPKLLEKISITPNITQNITPWFKVFFFLKRIKIIF